MHCRVEDKVSESTVGAASFSVSIAGIAVGLRAPAPSPIVELRESCRGPSTGQEGYALTIFFTRQS